MAEPKYLDINNLQKSTIKIIILSIYNTLKRQESRSCGVYSIQHYEIKFVGELWQVGGFLRWFSPGNPISSTNKTDRYDITEILLKVVLDTITLNSPKASRYQSCLTLTKYMQFYSSFFICVCIVFGDSILKRGGLGFH